MLLHEEGKQTQATVEHKLNGRITTKVEQDACAGERWNGCDIVLKTVI